MAKAKKKTKRKRRNLVNAGFICSGVSLRFVFDHVIQNIDKTHMTFIVWNGKGDGDLVKMPIAGLPYSIRKRLEKQDAGV